MGAWGTAIFSDDVAVDTRDAFASFIVEGLKAPDATERLVAECAEILADDEDAIVFWLALAATQWKLGRLLPAVRDRAIKIIDSGVDLQRFEGGPRSEINQRKRHLSKLRDQLMWPQPKPKKLQRRAKPPRT